MREDVLGDLHTAYQKYERQSRVPGLRYWIAALDVGIRFLLPRRATASQPPTGRPTRGPGSMPGILLGDLRYAVRTLRKSPGFTAVVVLSLAVGIGATSTIFSVLNAVVLRPLPFEEPDRLVSLQEFRPEGGPEGRPRAPTFLAWSEQNRTFEQMALGEGGQGPVTVSATGGTEQVWRNVVGADFFRLLGVQPILGRTFAVEDFAESSRSSSTVIISFGLWQQMFGGDPAALGQELTWGLEETKTIVGVMPPGFWTNPGGRPIRVWVGSDITQSSLNELQNFGRSSQVVGRLKRGVSVEQAQEDLRTISRGLALDAGTEDTPWRVRVQPLAERLSG